MPCRKIWICKGIFIINNWTIHLFSKYTYLIRLYKYNRSPFPAKRNLHSLTIIPRTFIWGHYTSSLDFTKYMNDIINFFILCLYWPKLCLLRGWAYIEFTFVMSSQLMPKIIYISNLVKKKIIVKSKARMLFHYVKRYWL
jgi:hypothetical protein